MKKLSFTNWLERGSDLLVVVAVAAILMLMVARVPTGALDALIAVNLSASIVILLLSLFLREAIKFPSFPTVLLLATLFRLGLNVASTKLILLQADAGEIIHAFGEVVVGGNPVVGGVVFLILVLIQFIVIAKGSERVSEVSARFSVDMMPGKQMAIDGDLNAGEIKAPEASRRRRELEREAKLYGATEGAMKFVKGDAIAGIVISCINILGGLVVGTLYLDMSLADAVTIFTVLTIGDGLVSQIPALLNSTAAGLVVTRVAADDEEQSNVGLDLVKQVISHPKAIAVAGTIQLLFGLSCAVFPLGFPSGPFVTIGCLGILVAIGAYARGAKQKAVDEKSAPKEKPTEPRLFGPSALEVRYHFALTNLFKVSPTPDPKSLQGLVEAARRKVSLETGVPIPPVRFTQGKIDLLPREYEIRIWDRPVDIATYLLDDEAFLPVDPDTFESPSGHPMVWPGRSIRGVRLPVVESLGQLDAGEPRFGAALFVDHVERIMRRHAWRFLGVQEAHFLVEAVRGRHAELVDAVVPKPLALKDVADVLRALLAEGNPIRDLRGIFEAMARWPKDAKFDPTLVAENVRVALGGALIAPFVVEGRLVKYYAIDDPIEKAIANAPRGKLDADAAERIAEAFRRSIDPREHAEKPALVLVERRGVRSKVAKLLADHDIEAVVLVESDVPPHLECEAPVVELLDAAPAAVEEVAEA